MEVRCQNCTHCRVTEDAGIVSRTSPTNAHVGNPVMVATNEKAIETVASFAAVPIAMPMIGRLDVNWQKSAVAKSDAISER